MNHDGLLIARPHRQTSRIPLRGLFLCLVAVLLFKGFLFAQLGEQAYSERMALLQNGTFFEKAGAYVMSPEPATRWVAARMSVYF